MRGRARTWFALGVVAVSGCLNRGVTLPPGCLPPDSPLPDLASAGALAPEKPATATQSNGASRSDPLKDLPGATAPPVIVPQMPKEATLAEREKTVEATYPRLSNVAASQVVRATADAPPVSLAELQQMAAESSPVLRRARAEAESTYGQVIQAGLHPNPTVGYQADQIQPRLALPPTSTASGAGQQGGFINQLIKTAGKLGLAQKVAGFDYINALVAVRRAQVDVTAAVRAQYFAVLVAQQGVEINRALVQMADEAYQLQLRETAAGEKAGYEPLQLYAQAEQARNALVLAEANYRAAWRQLAAAVGRPDLSPRPIAGKADIPAPVFDPDFIQARVLSEHTDILTARNTLAQAQTNLVLQRRQPIPDLATNQVLEYDNLAQVYQVNLQFGIQVPVFDRNQGNIHAAQARIGKATANIAATENELVGKLAEAFGRYNANRQTAERYRERILPNLARAYKALIHHHRIDPDKVAFDDVILGQQNYAQALQAYLAALDAQWKAVVDVANVGQLDELFPSPVSAK